MAERKKKFGEKIMERLDITEDLLPGGSYIEIHGQSSILVRGCGQITLYTRELIRLSLRKGYLDICGEELICTSYFPKAVGIEGRIKGVNFTKVGD